MANFPAALPPDRRGWWHNNSLALACFALFLVFLLAQSATGWKVYNNEAQDHQQEAVSYPQYLATGHFVEATFENWESEFLQMGAFVVLTAFLVQRGSAESKRGTEAPQPGESDENGAGPEPHDEDPRHHRHDPDAPWPVRRGGPLLTVYENSLAIAFSVLFALAILGHALGGAREYSEQQESHGQPGVTTIEFVQTSEFWFQSFQNWQSEFLAVGSIVVLTIFLRQRGSPESKPVHAPMAQTGG